MDKVIYANHIYDLLELLPDEKQNPVSELGDCLYSYGNDHCIAGEILSMLGFDLPDEDDKNSSAKIDSLIDDCYPDAFDDDAIEMLTIGQTVADRLTHAGDPLAWSLAKRDMSLFYKRLIANETKQRNLQAGY